MEKKDPEIKINEVSMVKDRRWSTIPLFFIILVPCVVFSIIYYYEPFIVSSILIAMGFLLVTTTKINNAYIPLSITVDSSVSTLTYSRQRSIGKYQEITFPLDSITSIYLENLWLDGWRKNLVIEARNLNQKVKVSLFEEHAIDVKDKLEKILGL
ncbi:MAG: hypothetical protein ACFFCS_24160 [Candidatus Hodarchaeota archaeon]